MKLAAIWAFAFALALAVVVTAYKPLGDTLYKAMRNSPRGVIPPGKCTCPPGYMYYPEGFGAKKSVDGVVMHCGRMVPPTEPYGFPAYESTACNVRSFYDENGNLKTAFVR